MHLSAHNPVDLMGVAASIQSGHQQFEAKCLSVWLFYVRCYN